MQLTYAKKMGKPLHKVLLVPVNQNLFNLNIDLQKI
jgi:hypothetical protein